MIHFILVQNPQGRARLSKWYVPFDDDAKRRIEAEVYRTIVKRGTDFTNFVEFNIGTQTHKLVYRRYGGLSFALCIGCQDNELVHFEAIQQFVELLDASFNGVCEMDLLFSFAKAYTLLDEFILAGYIAEPSIERALAVARETSRSLECK